MAVHGHPTDVHIMQNYCINHLMEQISKMRSVIRWYGVSIFTINTELSKSRRLKSGSSAGFPLTLVKFTSFAHYFLPYFLQNSKFSVVELLRLPNTMYVTKNTDIVLGILRNSSPKNSVSVC